MKIALLQLNAMNDKKKNIQRAIELTLKAIGGGAEFILLPEVFNYRGVPDPKSGYHRIAETIPGESAIPFMIIARARKVSILLGSIYEKAKGSKKVYNTSIFINADGEIKAEYRKMNLFDAHVDGKIFKESRYFLAGKKSILTKVNGFKVGISVCYDLRFPELYRNYAKAKVDMVCVPSSFTRTTGRAHWEILLRARAIENLCYVLAPGQIGFLGGDRLQPVPAHGHSMVVDPWGSIVACGSGDKEEIVYAEVNKDKIIEARQKLPGIVK